MLAGIGLFFSGLKIVSNMLKNITSRKFRLLTAKWTGNIWLGSLWGFLSGAISQSSTNTTFILTGLVSGGMVSARNAFPIISWSNVGTTILIFLVAINMNLAILFLLGLSGILFGLGKVGKTENILGAVFGIFLLLFGFQFLKTGSQTFSQLEIVNELIKYTENSYLLPILLGALLRFVIHSSSTVTVIIMTISHTGIIGINEVILLIYGMGFGEGLTVMALSSNIKGTAKQITLFKVFESFFGSSLMLILYFVEILFDIPLIKALLVNNIAGIEQQSAFIFLGLKIVPTLALTFLYTPIYNKLVKISPPTSAENLGQLMYINEHSMRDSETAMSMIEKEHTRIIHRFPDYLNKLREEESVQTNSFHILHKANEDLFHEIEHYLKNIAGSNLTHESSERFLNIQNRMDLIADMENYLYLIVFELSSENVNSEIKQLFFNITESLHAILFTVYDAAESSDEMDFDILIAITDDKSELMEQIRKTYLNNSGIISPVEKANLVNTTDLYQRIFWIVNKWAIKSKNNL
jgi:phosphate:Na+ symporter